MQGLGTEHLGFRIGGDSGNFDCLLTAEVDDRFLVIVFVMCS